MGVHLRRAVAEYKATTLFVGISYALVVATGLSGWQVWPTVLAVLVLAAGGIAGAHVNPAVTLGLACAGRFPWIGVFPYWVAQLLGAATGVYIAMVLTTRSLSLSGVENFFVKRAEGATTWEVTGLEAGFAALLFLGVCWGTDRRNQPLAAPLAIWSALAVGVYFAERVSGGALNPAIAAAPYLLNLLTLDVAEGWGSLLLSYIGAPLVCAAVVGFTCIAYKDTPAMG